jgi:hypothetical protein
MCFSHARVGLVLVVLLAVPVLYMFEASGAESRCLVFGHLVKSCYGFR